VRHVPVLIAGGGPVGMTLARMEGRIAIGRLLRRFPDLHRAGTPQRGGRARFRGYLSYPLALG